MLLGGVGGAIVLLGGAGGYQSLWTVTGRTELLGGQSYWEQQGL